MSEIARREQRLAAKLRENLKRRKEQARARSAATGGKPPSDSEQSIEMPNQPALKPAPDSDS
jgi:hypothetical protein